MNASNARRRPRWVAATAVLGLGAIAVGACTPSPQDGENSHRSRYSRAVYTSSVKNTRVVVATGWNDPASGPIEKSISVDLVQSWCAGTTLVTRELTGTAADYFGKTNPAYEYSTSAANVTLNGLETSTPAGPGCAEPATEGATFVPLALDAFVVSDVRGSGERLEYTRDDGGEYTYQDATASGGVLLPEIDGAFGFDREAAEPGETWLWEAFWADARGVDIAAAVPQT